MADALTDVRIARVFTALDAGRAVALSEREDNPGWHSYDHSYTLRAAGAGVYRLSHREQIDDAGSVPSEREHDFDRDGLRGWLGRISEEALADACVELPGGKFEMLAEHRLPGEAHETEARPRKRAPRRRRKNPGG